MFFTSLNSVASINVINGVDLSADRLESIFYFGKRCTATFISKKVFVTSAHCVRGSVEEIPALGVKAKLYKHPDYSLRYFQRREYYSKFSDVAIGVLEQEVKHSLTKKPLPICANDLDEGLIGDKLTLVGCGCSSITRRSTSGQRRYGHSWIKSLDNSLLISDAKDDGGVSCPGDSGGPYLLHTSESNLCVASINFYSDRVTTNFSVSLMNPAIKNWIEKLTKDLDIDICGLNTNCNETAIPLIFE